MSLPPGCFFSLSVVDLWSSCHLELLLLYEFGLDGPSALNCGLCGSILADVRVDVGRFLSPKAAPDGNK